MIIVLLALGGGRLGDTPAADDGVFAGDRVDLRDVGFETLVVGATKFVNICFFGVLLEFHF